MLPGFVFPADKTPDIFTIESSQGDFNLFEALGSPTVPQFLIVRILSTVTLYQTDYGKYCFTTGNLPDNSIVYLYNEGKIYGHGGFGGSPRCVCRRKGGTDILEDAQLGASGGAGRGYVDLDNLLGHGGYVAGYTYNSLWPDPLAAPIYIDVRTEQGEESNSDPYGEPLTLPGNPARYVDGASARFSSAAFVRDVGLYPPHPPSVGEGVVDAFPPAEDYRPFPADSAVFPAGAPCMLSGGDGGSCIQTYCPMLIHNIGEIFAGGGGGVGGDGGACYFDYTTGVYTFPGTTQDPDLTAQEIEQMSATGGADWGEDAEYGWLDDTMQGLIDAQYGYGGVKFSPGSSGKSVKIEPGGDANFTKDSDDPAKLRGPVA